MRPSWVVMAPSRGLEVPPSVLPTGRPARSGVSTRPTRLWVRGSFLGDRHPAPFPSWLVPTPPVDGVHHEADPADFPRRSGRGTLRRLAVLGDRLPTSPAPACMPTEARVRSDGALSTRMVGTSHLASLMAVAGRTVMACTGKRARAVPTPLRDAARSAGWRSPSDEPGAASASLRPGGCGSTGLSSVQAVPHLLALPFWTRPRTSELRSSADSALGSHRRTLSPALPSRRARCGTTALSSWGT